MKILKKILLVLLILFIALQFIQPSKNKSTEILSTDITRKFLVPKPVQSILQKACYDCHSNNTHYPWYSYIQPFGLFLNKHIREGKEELNFSAFGSYSTRRQYNKLNAIEEQIIEEEMPLESYMLMHPEARLTQTEKEMVIQWTRDSRNFIKTKN